MRIKGPTFLSYNATVQGTAYAEQTVVHVRWEYMSLLAAQLFLTILILAVTIIWTYSADVQILKSNSLATMCALSENIKRRVGGLENLNEMEKNANIQVILQRANGVMKGLDIKSN